MEGKIQVMLYFSRKCLLISFGSDHNELKCGKKFQFEMCGCMITAMDHLHPPWPGGAFLELISSVLQQCAFTEYCPSYLCVDLPSVMTTLANLTLLCLRPLKISQLLSQEK